MVPRPIRVLIIEDSEAERYFLRRTIERCRPRCAVTEFSYAEEALCYLRETETAPPDAIFVDINMPRMDGFAFATEFAGLSTRLRGSAKLWIVSHSIDPLDREQADAHPAVAGFLSKSYTRGDIERLLPSPLEGD